MSAHSKIKWFGSVVLSGMLLVLAVMGGNWGTSYSATASVYAAPFIFSIVPSTVPAGSADTLVMINGSDFGTMIDTRVRLTGEGIDQLFVPDEVNSGLIKVTIPADLLDRPSYYIMTVIKSIGGTIPTIPTIPNPPDEEISNPVPFTVYSPFIYLPIVSKNASH